LIFAVSGLAVLVSFAERRMPSTKYQVPSTKLEVQSTKYKGRSTKHQAQSTKSKALRQVQSSKKEIWDWRL